MENASKALIIAGAILLAILLISLGIMIFNQAQDTVNNSGMSQAEISAFNNQFLKYEGTQKGSVVKSMINEVIASNSDESHINSNATVTVNSKSGTDIKTSDISTAETYTIELSYSTEGRVNAITYTKK
ncbi:MAG: hypothetical protein HFJ37_01830 [Clostridia bacterium]|nr:hypothetical protein [Clostridia bacterium]